MEKSVDYLSGQSLCLLRIVIMNSKKRQEWLKQPGMGGGGMGGFCMGCESSALKALEFPAVLLC